MNGRLTRDFRNFHHPRITEQDFAGPRAILDHRYKLVMTGRAGGVSVGELFEVRDDPAEKNNLAQAKPEVARQLARQLRAWQQSVLGSLTGADYAQTTPPQ
jgi:hypothetical protein